MRLKITAGLLTTTAALAAAADCECGYTVNAATSDSFALFTQIQETDFLHVQTLNPEYWIPQAYNVTPQNSRGPCGKAAQLTNVVPNPLASEYDWGGPNDPGLQLWVRSTLLPISGTDEQMVPMAEIVTARSDILYGSFRIGMKTTSVNGTCGAFFFYLNDTSEIDLEFLSMKPEIVNLVIQSPESTAENGYVTPGTPDFDNHSLSFMPGEGYHEYRFDWLPGQITFLVDGVVVRIIEDGVPDTAGRVHVSHWSNGNEGWSGGPPGADARVTVSYVKAYFNSSEDVGGGCVDGTRSCEIPNQLTPPDPGGENGNQTGRTFFFLGPENTTEAGGDIGGSGNGSNPTKGGAARIALDAGSSSVACVFIMLVAAIMILGA